MVIIDVIANHHSSVDFSSCGFLSSRFLQRSSSGREHRVVLRWVVLFSFFIYTFLRISPETAIVSLCGYSEVSWGSRRTLRVSRVFDRDTKCVAIFFFERSCVEQEIIRRPLTVRTAVTTKEKKLVRVMPVRWNTVNIVFGTWLIASYFLVTKISGIVPCLFIFLFSKWDIRGVLNRNLVYT